MNKENKKTMIPKLRFPEFREAEEWRVEPFDKLYSFKVTNSFSRDDLNYIKGTVKNIHYGDIHTKFPTLFDIKKEIVPYVNPSISIEKIKPESYCMEGDMIFADASEDLNDVGKSIEIVFLNEEKLVPGLHTLLARQLKPKLIVGFGGYLFKSDSIRIQIKKEAQGAKVLGISAGRLSNINVYYPKDKPEQQKIIATLTSIDNLITAQSEKIKALQDHKKGLMQHLFPVEGELVPRVRFREFRGDGKWEEKTLGDAGTFINGKAYKQEELLDKGKYRVLRVGNFFSNNHWYYSDLELEENKYCDKGDLLYAWSASFGPRIWNGEKVVFHYHIWKVIEKKGTDKKFLFLLLDFETEKIKAQQANGLGLLHITKGTIEGWVCHLPRQKEEQRRIANCLTCLDDLIISQSQKLEALKMQKKGLMQQLFPNPNDTDA